MQFVDRDGPELHHSRPISASMSGLHFGSARWQRTADKHLQDFLGSGAIDKPVELVAPLLRKAQNRDAAWHRTPLYSSQEFGPTRSPSSTFYKRHKELPKANLTPINRWFTPSAVWCAMRRHRASWMQSHQVPASYAARQQSSWMIIQSVMDGFFHRCSHTR